MPEVGSRAYAETLLEPKFVTYTKLPLCGIGLPNPVPLSNIVTGTNPISLIVAVPLLGPSAVGANTIFRLQLELGPREPVFVLLYLRSGTIPNLRMRPKQF
jgi:hypothetical protein